MGSKLVFRMTGEGAEKLGALSLEELSEKLGIKVVKVEITPIEERQENETQTGLPYIHGS